MFQHYYVYTDGHQVSLAGGGYMQGWRVCAGVEGMSRGSGGGVCPQWGGDTARGEGGV